MASSSNNNLMVRVPSGFRFFPTDEELVLHYLMKKINNQELPSEDLVKVVKLYSYANPEALIGSHEVMLGNNEWYFFTTIVKKNKNGRRISRITPQGVWKASGGDSDLKLEHQKIVYSKINFVFNYSDNNNNNNKKTNWLMQEYRIVEPIIKNIDEDEWVLCKVYNHKDYKNTTPPIQEISCNAINSEAQPISIVQVQTKSYQMQGLEHSSHNPGVVDMSLDVSDYLLGSSSDSDFQNEQDNYNGSLFGVVAPFVGHPLPSTAAITNSSVDDDDDDMLDIHVLDQPNDFQLIITNKNMEIDQSVQQHAPFQGQPLPSTATICNSNDHKEMVMTNSMLTGYQYPSVVASKDGSNHISAGSSRDATFEKKQDNNNGTFPSMMIPFQGDSLLPSTAVMTNSSVHDDVPDIDAFYKLMEVDNQLFTNNNNMKFDAINSSSPPTWKLINQFNTMGDF